MKKRILSMILAIAMVVSVFAGIAVTASAAEGTYVLADAIAVGDTVIMATADGTNVFIGITSKNIGDRADATPDEASLVSAEAAALTVVAGSVEGSFAFQLGETYLGWTTGNNLYALNEVTDESSWTVTIENGIATVLNVKDSSRKLQYNSSSPRFCAYTSSQKAIAFYKLAEGEICTHADATSEVTTAATCTEDGLMTYTCSCGYSWTKVIEAAGHKNDDGVVTTEATCTVGGVKLYTCTVCGSTKEYGTLALGHLYVDGTCTRCGATQAPSVSYVGINLETITEGKYIIAAVRSDAYPTVYPATSKLGADINVTETAITAESDVITSADFTDDVQVFTFTGNNTDGFAISADVEGEIKYLGVSDYSANRKLAWGTADSKALWTVEALEKGGYILKTEGYVVMQNSTTTSAIRGYKSVQSGASSMGIFLFAETAADDICFHENPVEVPAVDPTCTTDGNTPGLKCADCGAILVGCEPIPAQHTLGYSLSVDGKIYTEFCSGCDFEEEHEVSTIAEAKAYTDDTVVYYVAGVVTYISGRTVYIEDATGGLCLYFKSGIGELDVLNLGDFIVTSSNMTTFKGLLELDNPDWFWRLTSDNAIPNTEATLAALLADTTNEYLGQRVTITGLTVGTIESNGTTTLIDAEGNSIELYAAKGIDAIVAEGDVITITAIVSSYNGYQLIVNPATMTTDIIVGEPTPVAPVEKELKLSHTLNLASDISVNFAVATSVLANATNYYLECVIPVYEGNTQTGTKTVQIDPVLTGSYYYFTLTGITAINMNDLVEARLYWTEDGVDYVSTADIYSVATYAYAQLNKPAANISLKKLCADLLRYGAKAQTYKVYRTDALADADMTDDMKSLLSDINAVTFNNNKGELADFENNGVAWVGRGLDLNSKVVVKFIFSITDTTLNPEELSVKITYENYQGETVTMTVKGAEVYNATHGYYAFSFDGLLAAELRSVLNAVIYNGETRLSNTSVYSVDTYGNGRTGTLLDLCKALIAYSDTALAFFNK